MELAVAQALKNTAPGEVCVLSAASASFGIFKDYTQRGAAYKDSLLKQAKTVANERAVNL